MILRFLLRKTEILMAVGMNLKYFTGRLPPAALLTGSDAGCWTEGRVGESFRAEVSGKPEFEYRSPTRCA